MQRGVDVGDDERNDATWNRDARGDIMEIMMTTVNVVLCVLLVAGIYLSRGHELLEAEC